MSYSLTTGWGQRAVGEVNAMTQTSFRTSAPKPYEPIRVSNTCRPQLNSGRALLCNSGSSENGQHCGVNGFLAASHVESDAVPSQAP
jgi:hypothetical protein